MKMAVKITMFMICIKQEAFGIFMNNFQKKKKKKCQKYYIKKVFIFCYTIINHKDQ